MPATWSASVSTAPMAGSPETSWPLVVGDRGQHRGDQLGLGRQGDEFLGAGADGVGGAAGVGADAAGHHRRADALGLEAAISAAMSSVVVDDQQVGARAAAQGVASACSMSRAGRPWRPCPSRSWWPWPIWPFSRRPSEDAWFIPSDRAYEPEPSLMISVMVTPSRSSTTTTSPRATRRLLT